VTVWIDAQISPALTKDRDFVDLPHRHALIVTACQLLTSAETMVEIKG
jgi:hypothetical protein